MCGVFIKWNTSSHYNKQNLDRMLMEKRKFQNNLRRIYRFVYVYLHKFLNTHKKYCLLVKIKKEVWE